MYWYVLCCVIVRKGVGMINDRLFEELQDHHFNLLLNLKFSIYKGIENFKNCVANMYLVVVSIVNKQHAEKNYNVECYHFFSSCLFSILHAQEILKTVWHTLSSYRDQTTRKERTPVFNPQLL